MQFTLSLPSDAAQRIKEIVDPFGGTVGSYAARWAVRISMLPVSEQQEIDALLNARIARYASSSFQRKDGNTGATPAVMPQRRSAKAGTLRGSRSPLPEFETHPAHSDTPNEQDA